MSNKYFLRLTKRDIAFIKHAVTFCPIPAAFDVKLDVEAIQQRRADILEKIRMQIEAQDEWYKKMGWTKELCK